MKMKILALAAVASMGFAASADVLYWQVNNSDSYVTEKAYDQAFLRATGGEGGDWVVTQNYASDGETSLGMAVAKSTFDNGGYALGDLSSIMSTSTGAAFNGDISALSFYLELYDSAGNWLGQSNPIPYGSLGNAVSTGINAEFSGVNNALGSATGASYGVPEPTSGLLMLVGFGALALRRRKVA